MKRPRGNPRSEMSGSSSTGWKRCICIAHNDAWPIIAINDLLNLTGRRFAFLEGLRGRRLAVLEG
eukprot:scaffold484167_cov17-Prasinocladus_malaysianus.AAC.1